MTIIQGSDTWLEARKSKIGGSEVFSLIAHYCAKELREMGLDMTKEKPFRTIQEQFLKIKFGAELSKIDPVHSEFGNGLEGYVAYRLQQELPQLEIERTKDFIVNPELHKLAACSPDGYVEIKEGFILPDFDKQKELNSLCGRGILELKTANYFTSFDNETRLQYIFQLQYNMLVTGCKWGVLAVLLPKEKQFDEPFFKGKVLEMINYQDFDRPQDIYDLKYYIYPQLHGFQALIIKALLSFKNDLDNPEAYPRNAEDKAGIEREKKMLGELFPEKYGTLTLEEESELDELLNQRMIAQGAMLDAEKEMRNCEAEIIWQTKKYCEIIGSKHKIKWTSDGKTRFYKLNKK